MDNQQSVNQPINNETQSNPGWTGPYNRESGKKTLVLIGVIITIVTILSISSLLMINKKSSVLIQNSSTEKTNKQPTIRVSPSSLISRPLQTKPTN